MELGSKQLKCWMKSGYQCSILNYVQIKFPDVYHDFPYVQTSDNISLTPWLKFV